LHKIVITGASGFIGSALITRLKKENIPYVGLTRKNINGLTTISSYDDYFGDQDSILIHLAQPNNSKEKSNGEEIKTLEGLLSSNWKHIIYISSATVYGDKIESPRKTQEEIFGYNDYTNVKLKCEKITLDKNGTCLRFSNVYGPDMSNQNVISEILLQMYNSEKIVVKNRYPIRDFLWIDDAIDAIIQTIKIKPSGIINVGSGFIKKWSVGKYQSLTISSEDIENYCSTDTYLTRMNTLTKNNALSVKKFLKIIIIPPFNAT
jgi:UDP-glucose 4-epimerase